MDPMERQVPTIFAPITQPVRLSRIGRWVAAGVAGACLVVLIVAAYLQPDPAGVGTEARLGMQECSFLMRTGLPCAACGMTTSFDHFVRGQWLRSAWVQPMGFVLAGATCLAFWISVYIAWTARPAHRLFKRLPTVKLVVAIVGFGIAAWGWKIALTLGGIAGTAW